MTIESVSIPAFNSESLADNITNLYTQWVSARQVHKARQAEVIQYLYATSTKETPNNETSPWSHSTHIPKLTQIFDNLGANYTTALFGDREFFTFNPADESDLLKGKREAVMNYLMTKHEDSKFVPRIKQILYDWVQKGLAVGRVEYVVVSRKNPITQAAEVIYEGPQLVRISPDDIEFDITAASFAESPKIVRSLQTMGAFCRSLEENPDLQYEPTAVAKVKDIRHAATGVKTEDWHRYNQYVMDGFQSYQQYLGSGKIELLTFYGDIYDNTTGELHRDRIIVIADRKFVLSNRAASDLGNIGQIYARAWRQRPDNLRGMGPLENLIGMQYLIDHLENSRADAFDQMISPDEVYIGQVETEKDGPVRRHFIDDGNGDVKLLRPDSTVLQADFQIQLKEAQMEAFAGAPREAMGIRTPGEKTKFEFAQLTDAASRMFQVKIEEFEELVEDFLNAELELAQRNLNTVDVVRTIDDDIGAEAFRRITRDDLLVKGRLRPVGASHYARQSRLVQELASFSNILAGDPSLAMHYPALERAKVWEDMLGFRRYKLMKPFGAIAEQVEAQKAQTAATQVLDEHVAASETANDLGNL